MKKSKWEKLVKTKIEEKANEVYKKECVNELPQSIQNKNKT